MPSPRFVLACAMSDAPVPPLVRGIIVSDALDANPIAALKLAVVVLVKASSGRPKLFLAPAALLAPVPPLVTFIIVAVTKG